MRRESEELLTAIKMEEATSATRTPVNTPIPSSTSTPVNTPDLSAVKQPQDSPLQRVSNLETVEEVTSVIAWIFHSAWIF